MLPASSDHPTARRAHLRALPVLVAVVALILSASSPLAAAKEYKEKPKKGRAGLTFTNETGETVHGLNVQLSNKAEVVPDGETNRPGPFMNVDGNWSSSIGFSNPVEPIEPGSEPFELLFTSYKSGLKVTKWWWLDDKGKMVGKKQTP